MLNVGDKAPEFSLKAQDGKAYSLGKLRGSKVVLYFYPKDGTPGCTIQSCAFRDRKDDFQRRGAIILGVSADGLESHAHFAGKYRLNFPLLADIGGKTSKKYGVWKEKSFLGRKFRGIERSTFIIDETGRIAAIFLNVNPLGHANGMLGVLNTLPKMPMAARKVIIKGNGAKPKKPKKK